MRRCPKQFIIIIAGLLVSLQLTGCTYFPFIGVENLRPTEPQVETMPQPTEDPNKPTSLLTGKVDFEKEIDSSKIDGFYGNPAHHRTSTYWIDYAEEGLLVDKEKYGEHGMKVIPVNGTYNYVVLNFGEVLPQMSIINFDLYVDSGGNTLVRYPNDFLLWSVFSDGHSGKELCDGGKAEDLNRWNGMQVILSDEEESIILFFEHRYYAEGVIPVLYIDNIWVDIPDV